MLLNKDTHTVDVEKWKNILCPRDLIDGSPGTRDQARRAYYALELEWNLRTSGAGIMMLTVLYALRAHMRGRVHCHDHDYEAQAKFLEKALPFINHLIVPRPTPVEEYTTLLEKFVAAQDAGDEQRADRLADILDDLWRVLGPEERDQIDPKTVEVQATA